MGTALSKTFFSFRIFTLIHCPHFAVKHFLSQNEGMQKSTFSSHYDIFKTKLVSMRKAAGLTQRQLAKRLKREHSFVSRIELGERRLDVVEFYWVCRACDQDPKSIYDELLKEFAKLD